MQQLAPSGLAQWLDDPGRQPPQLLDVREPWEMAICRLGNSVDIPMQALPRRLGEIDRERPVVVICHHGHRSWRVSLWLAQQGFSEVFNLQGGVAAWAADVDPTMARY